MVVNTIACTATSCLQTHLVTIASGAQFAKGGHVTNVFSVLVKHRELLGTNASWLYLESGHGKELCDGGLSFRQMTDDCVRRSNSILTAAQYEVYGMSM